MRRSACLIAALAALALPAESWAAFPGMNGKIAFVCGSNVDICTMNPDGTGQVNLTNNPATEQNPTWSPDGTRIAFDSGPQGAERIVVINADGTGRVQVGSPPHYARYPSWSADGTRLSAIWCCPEDDDEIATFDATDGSDVAFEYASGFGLFAQEWSPDSM